jgi:hypothetical protein
MDATLESANAVSIRAFVRIEIHPMQIKIDDLGRSESASVEERSERQCNYGSEQRFA